MILPVTSSALRAYDALAQAHPLAATSLVSCATYASAELFRQICLPTPKPASAYSSTLSDENADPSSSAAAVAVKQPLNLRQGPRGILLMGIVGAFIHAPWITFWFNFLEKLRPGKNVMDVVTKIILDQTIGCPVYFILLSITTNVLFHELERMLCAQRRLKRKLIGGRQRRSLKKVVMKVTDGMANAVKLSWTAWPLLHAINYTCVPVKRRRLVIQAGGLAWAMFLCCLTASSSSSKKTSEEAATTVELLDSTSVQGFPTTSLLDSRKRRKGVLETAIAMTGGGDGVGFDYVKPSFIISEESTTTAADLLRIPAMAAKGNSGADDKKMPSLGNHIHHHHDGGMHSSSSIFRLRRGMRSRFDVNGRKK